MNEHLLFLIPPIVNIIHDYLQKLIVILHKTGINLFDGKTILPFLDYQTYRPDNLLISQKDIIQSFSLGKWMDLTDINSFCLKKEWVGYNIITESSSIYLIGGDAFADVKISYKFNLDDNSILQLPSMNYVRYDHTLTILGDRIYAIGGRCYNNILDTVEYYENNKWINVKSMNKPRYNHKSVIHKGKIFVFGGFNGSKQRLTVERYDPEENTWKDITYIPLNKHPFKVINFENLIYIIGGSFPSWTLHDKESTVIDIYDPDLNKWSIFETNSIYEDVYLAIL